MLKIKNKLKKKKEATVGDETLILPIWRTRSFLPTPLCQLCANCSRNMCLLSAGLQSGGGLVADELDFTS